MDAAGRIFFDACAATGPADWQAREDALRALSTGAWDAVAAYGHLHGLAGLVARSLGWAEQATGFRAPVLDSLEEARRGQLARHLVFKAAARRLADALQARGIPFIAFKGVVLAEEVYGDLSLRRFQDFDALVRRENVDEAFEAARALGYRLTHLDHVREHVLAGSHAASMEHPDGTAFDLHWKLAPDMDAATAEIVWRHGIPPGPAASFPGMRLSPAMTVVHLAKHFHMGKYWLLKPLVDFHVASNRFAQAVEDGSVGSAARELGLSGLLDVVSAVRDRSLASESGRSVTAPGRSLRARIALGVLTEPFLLDSPRHSRIGNWLRFLAAAGSLRATAHSLREILVPDRPFLARFFRRPYRANMYPRYYWRQLVKVVTLARK
jgi:hypothetical protein